MKIALFGTSQLQFGKVYTPEVLKKLSKYGEHTLYPDFNNTIRQIN